MKIPLMYLMIVLSIFACAKKNTNNDCLSIDIALNEIFINYYENDSLNDTIDPVIPRLYYEFYYNNRTNDSLYIKLPSRHNLKELASSFFVVYRHGNSSDTIHFTDYENFEHILLEPNNTSGFIIKVPVLEDSTNDHVLALMKEISETGTVYLDFSFIENSSNQINECQALPIPINKTENFKIYFRDINDNAIE